MHSSPKLERFYSELIIFRLCMPSSQLSNC